MMLNAHILVMQSCSRCVSHRWNNELTQKLDVRKHQFAHRADLVAFKCFIQFVFEAWVRTSDEKEMKGSLGGVWIGRELGPRV